MCQEWHCIFMPLKWGCHGGAELIFCQGHHFTGELVIHKHSMAVPADRFEATEIEWLSCLKENHGDRRGMSLNTEPVQNPPASPYPRSAQGRDVS